MKELTRLALLVSMVSSATLVGASEQPMGNVEEKDFLPLGEPERQIDGAYLGGGLATSSISHKLHAEKVGEGRVDFSKSGVQMDISALAGFGSAFYKRNYIGIEMEFFKRLGGGESFHSNGELGLRRCSDLGLNLDVRPGYLFPLRGALVYATVGVARVRGQVVSKTGSHQSTFGSYYPTVGIGIEQMINSRWSVRGDIRRSITSKDDGKQFGGWKYDAKPNRTAMRILLVRNI